MIVLDTDVVSELMRASPDERVLAWVDQHPTTTVATTAITAAELRYGVARLADGRRKLELSERVEGLIEEDFRGRILAFDSAASARYAQVVSIRDRRGRPIAMADAQIAAICAVAGAQLATRNVADFVHAGIEVLDPWTD